MLYLLFKRDKRKQNKERFINNLKYTPTILKTIENFENKDLFKIVLRNVDTEERYELVTLSQLNKNIKKYISNNLALFGMSSDIIIKDKLDRFIELNSEPSQFPDNDIIFAIKRSDISNLKLTENENMIVFEKENLNPIYVYNATYDRKVFNEHPTSAKFYELENFLTISVSNIYTKKTNITPITIENDTINGKFINLQEFNINDNKLYRIILSNVKTNYAFYKSDI